MRSSLLVLAAAGMVLGLAACGGDSTTDETSSGEDFAAAADRACASVTRAVVRSELRVGAYRSDPETARVERAALPLRVAALERLQRLDPSPDVKPLTYKRYLALREAQIEANRKEVAAFEAGDKAGFSKYGAQAADAAEAHVRIAHHLGLRSCALRLSPAALRASRETVLKLQATGRTKKACGDDLVTPQYIKGTYPRTGIAGCLRNAKAQRKQPLYKLRFLDYSGVDGIVATVTFGAAGKRLAGQTQSATLVYQDGRWKLFEIKSN